MASSFGLLGEHLGHSWSPVIHQQLGSIPYALHELAPQDVAAAIADHTWTGYNVTIPYKVEAARLADIQTERVRATGAANTLVRQSDGRILADNTDVLGFTWLLEHLTTGELGMSAKELLSQGSAVVLGTGGAARAVCYALHTMGAQIKQVSRSGELRYDNLPEAINDAVLIVNTTPVGMYPACPQSPLSDEVLLGCPRLKAVCDIVYNPLRTGLMMAAERLGIATTNGLGMLVAQALYSSELFQHTKLDPKLIPDITQDLTRRMTSIALIGMPGSGKTAAGKRLARQIGRPFVDADVAFELAYAMSPADYISSHGVDAFRTKETELLAREAQRSGIVLACGGGVVTRPENYELLHQMSTIVMIDRPLEELSSAGRPISQRVGITALAEQRMPLYRSWADAIVPCTGSAEGDAQVIQALLGV